MNDSFQRVNPSPNFAWETGYGGEEQNGTFNMMGNMAEMCESAYDGTLDTMDKDRVTRGGRYDSFKTLLASSGRANMTETTGEHAQNGLRIVAILEPASIAMIGMVGGCALFIRRAFML